MVQSNSVFYPKHDNNGLLSAKKNELRSTEFYSVIYLLYSVIQSRFLTSLRFRFYVSVLMILSMLL